MLMGSRICSFDRFRFWINQREQRTDFGSDLGNENSPVFITAHRGNKREIQGAFRGDPRRFETK